MVIILVIILFILLIAKIYHDTNIIKVHNTDIQTKKLPSGKSLSILQLSDIHGKSFGQNNERLYRTIEKMEPDIVVVTGDMIDRKTHQLESSFELAEKLVAFHEKIYFVSGNHEWGNPKHEVFFKGLQDRGVHLLDNRNETIQTDDFSFQLAGLGDAATNHDKIHTALKNMDHNKLTVLLSHAPDVWKEQYPEEADVILSGHTHGGQIRFPLIGALIAPDQGYFPKYDKGIFNLKENQHLYIDSGLGTSWIDVRFLNQSQVTLINIHH